MNFLGLKKLTDMCHLSYLSTKPSLYKAQMVRGHWVQPLLRPSGPLTPYPPVRPQSHGQRLHPLGIIRSHVVGWGFCQTFTQKVWRYWYFITYWLRVRLVKSQTSSCVLVLLAGQTKAEIKCEISLWLTPIITTITGVQQDYSGIFNHDQPEPVNPHRLCVKLVSCSDHGTNVNRGREHSLYHTW